MSAGQIIRRRPPSPSPALRAQTHMHMPTSIPSPMAKWGYRYSVRDRGARRRKSTIIVVLLDQAFVVGLT